MIAAIVKEVLAELNNGKATSAPVSSNGRSLHYKSDYPLSEKRRELVKTATGKTLDDITLDAIMSGTIEAEEIRITPQTLEYQAQIAESISRPQLAGNMRRAGELTRVPDERILEMYNALRPNRSTKAELLAMADELEKKYEAKVCAAFVREAAGVYEARDVLKE
jgi:propanediol dehydratase small subunit